MSDIQKLSKLSNKFQQTKDSLPKDKHKYLHVKTVENFIYHLGDFSSDSQKEMAYNALTKYINFINETTIKITNAKESHKIFEKFLAPLVDSYVDSLGFRLAIKPWIWVLWTLIIFLVLYSFVNFLLLFSGLFTIDLIILFRQIYYHRQKKLYSFMH